MSARTFSISTRDFPDALPHHLTVGQEVTLTVRCSVVGLQAQISEMFAVGGRMPDGNVEKSRQWTEQTGLDAEFLILGLAAE